ncbi:hypothetical protein GCM10017673_38100 [Streptosporangium violaceochromogenes]|nr:hypothetical protein GCM10017673_38100 [Streptosporangium violaceochromogenes]
MVALLVGVDERLLLLLLVLVLVLVLGGGCWLLVGVHVWKGTRRAARVTRSRTSRSAKGRQDMVVTIVTGLYLDRSRL